MTKEEIIKAVNNFRGANREFSQEMGPIIESILDLVSPVEASDITGLTDAQLDALKPGDVVAKKTGKQYHAYTVSYKGEGAGEGICLTYVDASTIETVSYDRTESGWAYNSTDKRTFEDNADNDNAATAPADNDNAGGDTEGE